MNRFSRNQIVFAIMFGLLGAVAISGPGHGQSEPAVSEVRFLWAFGAMVGPEANREGPAIVRTAVSGGRARWCFVRVTSSSLRETPMNGQIPTK